MIYQVLDVPVSEDDDFSSFTDKTSEQRMKEFITGHKHLRRFVKGLEQKDRVKIFLDEFPVSGDDLKHIYHNIESHLTLSLRTVKENCSQMWAAFATGDLMDIKDGTNVMDGSGQDLASLAYLTDKTGCKVWSLALKMRNTSNIAKIAPENMSEFGSMTIDGSDPVAMLPVAQPSTVPGPQPHCVLVPMIARGGQGIFYKTLENTLHYVLSDSILHYSATGEHLAILCNSIISPRAVAEDLRAAGVSLTLYDAGVRAFDSRGNPNLFNPLDGLEPVERQKKDVEAWLTGGGGILVTHNKMFVGMEAPTVVLLTPQVRHSAPFHTAGY